MSPKIPFHISPHFSCSDSLGTLCETGGEEGAEKQDLLGAKDTRGVMIPTLVLSQIPKTRLKDVSD